VNWTSLRANTTAGQGSGTFHPASARGEAGSELAARFLLRERERRILDLLHRHGCMPLTEKRILDVGCGTGTWLRDLIGWGADPANLFGVEWLPASAARARRLCPEPVTIACSNAATLEFPPEAFDIVLQATVFSSVLDLDMRRAIASEMLRVVRPTGLILWYDVIVENPWNSCVHPLRKSEIRQLFPGCSLELLRVGLAPLFAKLTAPRSWRVSSILSALPPLCTHYLGAIHPPVRQP
jgi:SAM-dependent methyltransferase